MKIAATVPIKSNSTRVKDKNFKLLGDTICYEIYWVEISKDIHRETVGRVEQ